MSLAILAALVVMSFVLVFAQSSVAGVPRIAGVQIDLLPSLMVCVALGFQPWVVMILALAGGLFFDSLSANPLGVSLLPLFLVGWVAGTWQDLVLRETLPARTALGFAAGAAAPAMTWGLLALTGAELPPPWAFAWQLLVLGSVNAVAVPLWFKVVARLNRAFQYSQAPESNFRFEREIKRGRI